MLTSLADVARGDIDMTVFQIDVLHSWFVEFKLWLSLLK